MELLNLVFEVWVSKFRSPYPYPTLPYYFKGKGKGKGKGFDD
jgi:hypothetical protein